ncbi:MAG: DeoR/GlpR transcriptional regulator [Clostridia bacterium]|nr:DeoR/GlpR transcriptional regulator [Clostridia bacterium]
MSFDRREKIIDYLRKNNVVMLKDLEKMFPNVSAMTLRRDLVFFENLGEAVRIRGGARYVKNNTDQEDVYALRAVKNQEAKDKIAKIASRYIETGRSIFMDSGSTGMLLARYVPDLNLNILTSAPNVALEVSKRYKPTVTLIGGLINRTTLSVSGDQSLSFINSVNVDFAFMVATAFSVENGFTCGNYSEGELKRQIINKAKKTIVLIDSSKFGKSMPFTFADLENIDIIVTDIKPDDDVMNLCSQFGVEVVFE